MKRFLMLVAVATVAGAMYVAAAPGGQQSTPTAKQFTALKKQVTKLRKTVSALKKDEGNVKKLAVAEAGLLLTCMAKTVPIAQFGDATGQTNGYHFAQAPPATSNASDHFATALDVAQPTNPKAVWVVGGDSTCQTAVGGSQGTLRQAAEAAGISVRHASVQHAFVAHRP